MENKYHSRRDFLSTVAWGTIGTVGAAGMLANCTTTNSIRKLREESNLSFLEQAPEGEVLKAGLVGCGGRGTGAAVNFVDAGPNLEIVALGDLFKDQLEKCRSNLKRGRDIEVPDENCFLGFDSYRKVIDSGVDIVIFATPPHFRPTHVKAAIDAGKHVFQEKPIAVDPPGARIMMETTQKAEQKNLSMVSGTIKRYEKDSVELKRKVSEGIIGEVVSANIIRNGGGTWWVERQPEWSDLEYMIRNWYNFSWLSGDHIVEQFVHQLDAMSWFVGSHPLKAIGYGGRHQRTSGDLFDQFSIVYEYENGVKAHCATRQIDDCANGTREHITGTEGYADLRNATIYNHDGELLWEYPYPNENEPDQSWKVQNPFVQEHIELVTGIRTGNYINDSEDQIKSTRIAIMGRMAAYTGQEITWEEILNSDLRLGPETYDFGQEYEITEQPPVVGSPPSPTNNRYT